MTAAATVGGILLVGLPAATAQAGPADGPAGDPRGHTGAADRADTVTGTVTPGAPVLAPRFRAPALAARPSAVVATSHRKRHRPRRISPDARRIVRYTVRPGDTPSGLAVRFHAWTAELIAMNGSVLRIGERIRIPVVVAAVARERRQRARGAARAAARPSRSQVRRVVARTARRHGVDPQLALAVAWQESGWQMHVVSSAGAIGAMQVMPATGRWMSGMVGRRLHLRDLHDNATAGVVLLRWLDGEARRRVAIAGYYQGLAGVRRHGMYSDTRRYVANVLALERRFERGRYPV